MESWDIICISREEVAGVPKMKHVGQILAVACVYVGTVVGAGYATGQEIYFFFARYSWAGLIGGCLSGALFATLGALVLHRMCSRGMKQYNEVLESICGKRTAWMIEGFSFLFLFFVLAIVLAGAGATAFEQWGIDYHVGVLAAAVSVFLLACTNMRGVLIAQSVLVPFLVAAMFALALRHLLGEEFSWGRLLGSEISWPLWGMSIVSALLYVSYNFVGAMMALIALGRELEPTAAWLAGALGGLILGVLAMVVTSALLTDPVQLQHYEVPMGQLARVYGGWWPWIYGISLWIALVTTGISAIFALIDRLNKTLHTQNPWCGVLILLACIPLTAGGFSKLVQWIYPLSGLLGLWLVACILRGAWRVKC